MDEITEALIRLSFRKRVNAVAAETARLTRPLTFEDELDTDVVAMLANVYVSRSVDRECLESGKACEDLRRPENDALMERALVLLDRIEEVDAVITEYCDSCLEADVVWDRYDVLVNVLNSLEVEMGLVRLAARTEPSTNRARDLLSRLDELRLVDGKLMRSRVEETKKMFEDGVDFSF